LPDESLSTCPYCEPYGNFASTLRRARKQQAGKINACQQKHEPTDGREHSSKGEYRIRDVGNEQAGFPEPNAEADVLRVILREFCGQRLKRNLRLRERHAGFQPTYSEKIVRVALVEPRVPRLDRLRHHYRNEHFRVVSDLSANKSFGRDADNSERTAVELNRLPHNGGIAAEAALLAVVTNHGNGMCIRSLIFFGQNIGAHQRLHAVNNKESCRYRI